ncbi:cyanophycinase [Chromohalobacter beijerinckii]|uniref:Cyanophycinase n=3 Tax=Chromohalobacter TaxID=42054 RepID=A0A1Q8TA23_9GAMM|nr:MULTISPECIES: cyanophycinase [Chromohalobacter]CDQ33388.1 Cyanophycinase [Virgibacillus halodenitrificans]MCK0765702.1 cyanophycinase [Chromohalobacter beijerinckii]MCK2041648.1 cyanophycinase [Chromohalobacter moromii]MCK2044585.1 cyanophycinase [Chromohalobacter moromii]MCT8504261.1 cyanophycinase [Chromohalobacter moromii]
MTSRPPAVCGHIVAIGGAEDRSSELAILKRVFELAPEDNHEVAVIATASSIPEQVLPSYEAAFERLGATQVHALDIQDRQQAADADNAQLIKRSGVIFFTGGDQLRLTTVLGGSATLRAIRERLRAGAVVAGTSAGAAAMPSTMIYNGSASDALRKGAVNMTFGLGFVRGMVIDSHFLERGRFTRLMEVGASNPEQLGVGLGEDAAVIIYPNRILETIGPGHVIIIDSRDLASSNIAELEMGEPVAIENMILHAMVSGHGYDLDARRYLVAEELKAVLAGRHQE